MFTDLTQKIGNLLCIFSIKHDLARSCFQLWPKIGDEEADKISTEKTGEALAETVFFPEILSPSSPILGHN